MGGIHSSVSNSNYLQDNIKREIKKLIYDYEFWTKQNFCDDLQVLFHDKLIKFDRSDLVDASVSLGIVKKTTDEEKQELCEKISAHYLQRVQLLIKILKAIERNHIKVAKAGGEGDVCRNVDSVINNFYTCQKYKGLWLSEEQYNNLISNFKKNGNYSKWFNNINKLRENYFSYLKQLSEVVVKIKQDVDNSLDSAAFEKLSHYTNEIIRQMDNMSDILYLMAVNTV